MSPAVQISPDGNSFLSVPNSDVPALVAALSRAGAPYAVRGSSGGETVIDLGPNADLDVMEEVLMQVYPNS